MKQHKIEDIIEFLSLYVLLFGAETADIGIYSGCETRVNKSCRFISLTVLMGR